MQTAGNKIRVLDKKVAELIAAGEVVERPASAVKELMENCIDAGARAITLEIKNGGVSFIRVSDDGCGIAKEDVPTAFLRHATSKIAVEDDLAAIGTLGFRGEALASISAVSKVELITRTADELAGTAITLEGGEVKEISDAGCPCGTTVIIRELFFNTPARMKFLKKDTTEGNAVAAVAQRIALSHPEVSVRFIKDGREDLHTPGDNRLVSAVHAVLGREFASSLIEVAYELERIKATGFITKPTYSRANRNMQFFYINGRLVKSKTAMAALEEAYKNSIMTGKYPGCVLNLQMNPALFDVNVHPAKLEVRFVNERAVFEAVYYAVKTALQKNDTRPQLTLDDQKTPPGPSEQREAFTPAAAHTVHPEAGPAQELPAVQLGLIRHESEKADVLRDTAMPYYRAEANPAASAAAQRAPEEKPDFPGGVQAVSGQNAEGRETKTGSGFKLIGECFGTYILAEKDSELWMIDKHAAHERILYEKLKKAASESAQMLLEPVTVTLPGVEYAAAAENLSLFEKCGFIIEDFGGSSLIIRGAPLDLTGEDTASLLSELAGGIAGHKKEVLPQKLDWIYHSVACRAAVKAHDHTTPQEMDRLVRQVFETEDIRYCPHGRPVAFSISQKELEKKFGRQA